MPTSLPIELCDAIIFFIGSTKDLLNLALTCRQLCQLIIPGHIEYRQIRCSTSDKFWEHLLNRPDLAKRVHSITISDSVIAGAGVDRLIPRKFQMRAIDAEDEDLASGLQLKAFRKSIYVMKNLYSFDYSGPCPAPLLFMYLAHFSPELRVFKYSYEWVGPDWTPPWHDIIDTTHLNKRFKGLEYFSSYIRFQRSEYEAQHVSTVVDSFFQNNPSLEYFSLFIWDPYFEFPSPMGLLSSVHWPKIHTLSLGGNIIFLDEDNDLQLCTSLTQSFFSRHASLEKVRLRGPGIPIYPGTIQSDMLPKLNSLDLDFAYPVSELIPGNVLARLTNLSADLSNVPDSFITPGHFKNLRKLVTRITSNRITPLLEVIPNIERLDIVLDWEFSTDESNNYIVLDWGFSTDESNKKRDVLHFLPAFTRHVKFLTHLSLSLPFHPEDAALGEYAHELHNLDYIQFPCTQTDYNSWYRVIRSPTGTVGLEKHLEESDEWATHLWMGFDSSFEE